jgi:hypothetical protein
MKLESIRSYKKDAAGARTVVLFSVIASIAASVFMYWDARRFIQSQASRKVVIDKDNHAWLATERAFTLDDRKIQYEEHVKDFYRLFFAFDGGSFDVSVNRGLHLIEGELGKALYIKEYVEKSLAREITENNWKLEIEIIKVEVDVSNKPARGVAFAKQTLIRPAGQIVRNMNAQFVIDDAKISYDNPRGALIMGFDIFDNSRIKDEKTN